MKNFKTNLLKQKLMFFIVTFLLVTTVQTVAQVEEEDIFEMSLEDLLDVKVITASKSAEDQSTAPAVMTIVTDREIESYGDMTMGDVLDRIANVYVNGTYLIPKGNVSIRGKHTGLYDTHVLWLLNGRPMRESIHAGVNAAILNMFPVESIKRVEMIRGPGSVLYGTSAFQGVINIITKTADKPVEVYVSSLEGSFKTSHNQASVRTKINDDLSINFSMLQHKDDGWVAQATFENGDDITTNLFEQGYGLFLNTNYKKLTLNAYHGYDMQRQWGRSMSSWGGNLGYENKRTLIDLGYVHEFSDKLTTSINAGYNSANHNYIFLEKFADRGDYRYAHDWNFEISNNLQVNENFDVVFGGTGLLLNGEALRPGKYADGANFPIDSIENPDPFVNVPKYGEFWFNGYAQASYRWNILKFVLGGQANKVTGVDWNFVPRLGVIANVNEKIYAKVLMADAFRVGSFFERGATSYPSVAGNPELKPETIRTIEAQVGYSSSDMTLAGTFYTSQENDLIGRSSTSDSLLVIDWNGSERSVPLYINKGSGSYMGIELEGKKNIGKSLGLNASFTYQTSEDDNDNKDVYGLPTYMIKTGLNWKSDKGIRIGLWNSYYSGGGSTETGSTFKQMNGDVAAYSYLNANVNVDVFKLTGQEHNSRLYVNFRVVNALDEEINYPEVQRRNVNSIPGRPGRAFYAGLRFKF